MYAHIGSVAECVADQKGGLTVYLRLNGGGTNISIVYFYFIVYRVLQYTAVCCSALQCVAALSIPCSKDGRTVVVVCCSCFCFWLGEGLFRACKPATVVYIYNITEKKNHCNNKNAVWIYIHMNICTCACTELHIYVYSCIHTHNNNFRILVAYSICHMEYTNSILIWNTQEYWLCISYVIWNTDCVLQVSFAEYHLFYKALCITGLFCRILIVYSICHMEYTISILVWGGYGE